MQQRLDFASAEDFISFPRQTTLNLHVSEDQQKQAANKALMSPNIQERKESLTLGIERSLPQTKSASKELLHSIKKPILGKE